MKTFSKPWTMLLVQTDSLNGELLSEAIEALYAAGASNVNVLPTVTKKGRPGHVILIDVRPAHLDLVENAIVDSLGVSGWQRMETTHRHLEVQQVTRLIKLCAGSISFDYEIIGKQIADREDIRPEISCCREIRKRFAELGVNVSTRVLQQELALCFRNDRTEIALPASPVLDRDI